MSSRSAELRTNLDLVRSRIQRAATDVGRNADDIELVVVTKNFPSSDVGILADLGVHAIAENKAQEMLGKCDELGPRPELTVHFVGQLQSNKAGAVASVADVVQSVDRPKIVSALDRAAERARRHLDVLIQIGLDTQGQRGGVQPEFANDLAHEVASRTHLHLRGVMAVAPHGGDPAPAFARLREVAGGIQQAYPEADWISAGMSSDLEAALAYGATHLRVGTAILGSRASLG